MLWRRSSISASMASYAIQLYLVSRGTNATFIGFISGGISLTMLVGSLLAGRFSDKVPVGPTVCLAYLSICLCILPMTLTDNYRVMMVANSLVGLLFPLISAMLPGFTSPSRLRACRGALLSH